MNSFSASLSPNSWTEILDGNSYIAFDCVAASVVELHFNESASAPASSAVAHPVETWPNSWDYEGSGFQRGVQRIWARGSNSIEGVRE